MFGIVMEHTNRFMFLRYVVIPFFQWILCDYHFKYKDIKIPNYGNSTYILSCRKFTMLNCGKHRPNYGNYLIVNLTCH